MTSGSRHDPDEPSEAGGVISLPSWSDSMVRTASNAIGGPFGSRAGLRRQSWWTPLRVLLAMTLFTLLLGFIQKSPCADGNWGTPGKQFTQMCYSDVVPLWSDERLDIGGVPYRDTAVEYPVLTGGFMWLVADLTRGVHSLEHNWSQELVWVIITCVLLSLCALVVTTATAETSRGRPYDAAIFALSPLLIFHAFSNWDLLAMAFASAAIWAWARKKPVLSGVLIGLGTAAKLYPAFLLVAIVILALRTRRFAPAAWTTLAAVATWLAVNGPIASAYTHGWSTFYVFSTQRTTERSTLWAMYRTLTDSGVGAADSPNWVPPGAAVALLLAVALCGVIWAGLYAPTQPRLGQLAFLAVLAFLITTKVWSPQYSLWLVPLLALARPRWRINILWQLTEVGVWIATLMLLHGFDNPDRGFSYGWLMLLLLFRDGILLTIAGKIIWEMWHPEEDIVRASGGGDPAAGLFAGAPECGPQPLNKLWGELRCSLRRSWGQPESPHFDGADPPNSSPGRPEEIQSQHAAGVDLMGSPEPRHTLPE